MAKLVGQDGTGFVTPGYTPEFNVSGNAIATRPPSVGIPGTADTAWIDTSAGAGGRTIKVCLYDAGGNLVAVSAPIDTAANGLKSAAIAAAITGQNYTLVASISASACNLKTDSGTSNFVDQQWTAAHFPYASPPATLPAVDNTLGHEFVMYLTGTAAPSVGNGAQEMNGVGG